MGWSGGGLRKLAAVRLQWPCAGPETVAGNGAREDCRKCGPRKNAPVHGLVLGRNDDRAFDGLAFAGHLGHELQRPFPGHGWLGLEAVDAGFAGGLGGDGAGHVAHVLRGHVAARLAEDHCAGYGRAGGLLDEPYSYIAASAAFDLGLYGLELIVLSAGLSHGRGSGEAKCRARENNRFLVHDPVLEMQR